MPKIFGIHTNLNDIDNKYQEKFLTVSVGGSGVMSDLTFNNLTVGQRYRISGVLRVITAASFNGQVEIKNGLTTIGIMQSEQDSTTISPNIIFVATNSTLTFERSMGGAGTINGTGSRNGTYVQLEKIENYETTTQWT